MKKIMCVIISVLLMGVLATSPALSQEMSNEELLKELKLMKEKIKQLESQMQELKAASVPESEKPSSEVVTQKVGGVKGLEKRVKQLEDAIGHEVVGDKWYDGIQVSGLVEAEASYAKTDFKNPATQDTDASDVDLATVELAVDAKIAEHVDGHVLFKWEADDLFVDEGFITLFGSENFPAYLIAGRQYIPFGSFESHFVTDPVTLSLGETNEGAAVAGYRFGGELVDISAGVFNGRAKEIGKDDKIANFVGGVVVSPVENIMFGASYTSNLAAANSLYEQLTTDTDGDGSGDSTTSFVGGYAAFVTASFLDRFKVIGEYVASEDEFEAGELYTNPDTQKRQPAAWNLELGCAVSDAWEIAVKYEGSEDGDAGSGEFLPKSRYGAVVNWGFYENTNLAIEYLHGEFENDFQKTDVVTTQIAVEF